jgi:hypothetical protein
MNYLRRFESFSSEFTSHFDREELYVPISYGKFEDLISTGTVDEITDSEIEKIFKFITDRIEPSFQKKIKISYKNVKRFRFDAVDSVASYDISTFGGHNDSGYIIFYKFDDQWWLIEFCTNHMKNSRRVHSFLADTLDGVEKWCEDKLAFT